MKTTRALALVAATFLLLAPVANAEEKDLFHPKSTSIMVGVNFPADEGLGGGGEFIFVGGFMVNPYFGYQFELGAVTVTDIDNNDVTFYDVVVAFKLALPIAFVEPYVLGGAGLGAGYGGLGFPLHAAIGIDFNFGKVLVGAEARQVWLEVDDRDFDGLLVMSKFGFRF